MKKILCICLTLVLILGLANVCNAKISLTYLYGSYDYEKITQITNNEMNVISPTYFDLNTDGSLLVNSIDERLVSKMHNNGIKVTPFLSNHWDRSKGRNAINNAENLANQIANVISKYNLDGINIDIENLTETDREEYTNFVRLVREKLPEDKTVSVAVAANPRGISSGWQGSYDYEKLALYSDYLMVMAYDEHYEGGEEGSVAGIKFVEDSIKYALKYVSNDKIVLGVPFYGRYWKNGEETGGRAITIKQVESLINKYKSTITYDKNEECVIAKITINQGDTKPSINGRTLYEGTYTIYYENTNSMNAKINLIKKYNLRGIGAWSLGQENSSVWDSFSSYLKNNEDSSDSYTSESFEYIATEDENGNYWADSSISFVKSKGWIIGKTEDNFMPDAPLTRGEFVTIIARVLGLDISTNCEEELYWDIGTHWAKNAINAVTKTGIIEGYIGGMFKADKYITREEVAKVLSLLNSYSENEYEYNIMFDDVETDRWSYRFINQMAKKGIFNGYEDGTFRPENEITRAEMAVILDRMF